MRTDEMKSQKNFGLDLKNVISDFFQNYVLMENDSVK